MIVGHIGGAGAPYEIQKSLRFRASASAYLSRTPSVSGNRKTWTWSGWVKRGSLSAVTLLATELAATAGEYITFNSNGAIEVGLYSGTPTTATLYRVTLALYRDVSAHYHVVLVVDTPNTTVQSRVRLYVNGSEITSWTTNTAVPQNLDTGFNNTVRQCIGAVAATNYLGQTPFDGYVSEAYMIDGQALDPSYFGEVSAETGAWIPKKYTGTYGTNGFYLPFNDGSSLANLTADKSGNGNNWTANNISLTSGVTYDWMDDTPMNNFAVLNAVHAGRSTLTNGNLTASGATDLPTIIPDYGTWYFERGGLSQTWTPPAAFPSGSGDYNFGQRPWQSTGPTGGQKALCTKNLPAPSILNPKKHFDVVLATGANIKTTAEAVFPSNFLEWIKDRGNANNHQLIDTVRGTSAVLQSNTTAAETTYTAPSGSSVAWLWKAGGTPVTNNAGSIQSQVSANPQAGFSIVTYTGTGANATVGHGLGVAPKMVIVKNKQVGPSGWFVYHSGLGSTGTSLRLDTTQAGTVDGTVWNTAPTSTVFGLGTSGATNTNGHAHVAYCFAEIPGFSKIGSYTGNGSADGPFVYCGFRPAYVLIKCSSTTGNWVVIDDKRAGYNVDNDPLYANLSNAEATTDLIDITSNGFKVRSTNADVGAAQTYIFAAFAEQPFQFANAR